MLTLLFGLVEINILCRYLSFEECQNDAAVGAHNSQSEAVGSNLARSLQQAPSP